MARYVLEDKDGNVVNIIEWDGAAKYNPPAGLSLVADPGANRLMPASVADGGQSINARLATLEADVAVLKAKG